MYVNMLVNMTAVHYVAATLWTAAMFMSWNICSSSSSSFKGPGCADMLLPLADLREGMEGATT